MDAQQQQQTTTISDFYSSIDLLMRQASVTAHQISSTHCRSTQQKKWASAQISIDRFSENDSKARLTSQNQSKIVSDTLSLYQYYKDAL